MILFFEGLRSERHQMETVRLNLAHRWYLGYQIDEPLPDHPSLTRIRTRRGVGIFRRFFEQVVERCQAAGLVWGKELFFDGTQVGANAAMDSLSRGSIYTPESTWTPSLEQTRGRKQRRVGLTRGSPTPSSL